MKRSLASGGCLLAAFVAVNVAFHADTRTTARDQGPRHRSMRAACARFEIVPLETVSETSSNATSAISTATGIRISCWSKDGTGRSRAGCFSATAKDISRRAGASEQRHQELLGIASGHDRKRPPGYGAEQRRAGSEAGSVNDGKGHFTIGGRYGDPKWSTRNAAVGDLNGDGYPDIAVANRGMTSFVCFNDGTLDFDCRPLEDSPSAATVAIADMNGDGANDVFMPAAIRVRASCISMTARGTSLAGNPGGRRNHPRAPWRSPTLTGSAIRTSPLAPRSWGALSTSTTAKPPSEAASNSKRPRRALFDDRRRSEWRPPPEILVGYVEAPGVVYFNDGQERSISRYRSATARARSTAWRQAI